MSYGALYADRYAVCDEICGKGTVMAQRCHDRFDRENMVVCALFSVWGPFMLVGTPFCTGFYGHGLKFW